MKFKGGQVVTYTMLYGGSVTAVVGDITDTHVTLVESWIAEDTGEVALGRTTYIKHTDDKGEYIVVWEYHGEECRIYGEEE